jgi:hypothetical protein
MDLEQTSLAASPERDALRMQILATEHWSLLAARTMTWNEIFSRASMYFTVLSASVVALALVAQATDFGTNFTLFALLLLPVVILMGFFTFLRLTIATDFDALQVMGMNRIRHAYLDMAPELRPYFITSPYDDMAGTLKSQAMESIQPRHVLASTPLLVGVVDAIVAGAYAALVFDALGFDRIVCAVAGVIGAGAMLTFILDWSRRDIAEFVLRNQPLFPTPQENVPVDGD